MTIDRPLFALPTPVTGMPAGVALALMSKPVTSSDMTVTEMPADGSVFMPPAFVTTSEFVIMREEVTSCDGSTVGAASMAVAEGKGVAVSVAVGSTVFVAVGSLVAVCVAVAV